MFWASLRLVAGLVLTLLGLVGLLLPILPGWLLLIPGLLLLGTHFHWPRRLLRFLREPRRPK